VFDLRTPRPRIARPGEPEPKPIPLTCPLCGELLGGLLLDDPKLRAVAVSIECTDGVHSELEIRTLDIVRKELDA